MRCIEKGLFTLFAGLAFSSAAFHPGQLAAQTNGVWTQTIAGGLWSAPGNWSGTNVASGTGATADFSTLILAGNDTVHLDTTNRIIGNLIFGDQNNAFNWTLDNNGSASNVLTLAASAGAPTITVSNDAATISAVLAGNQGLTLSGGPQINFDGQLFNNNYLLSNASAVGILTLNPSAAESYTGATTVNTGALAIDFANLSTPTNLINSGSALSLGNGTLTIKDQPSATATSQAFNGTTLNAGASAIAVSANGNMNAASLLALGAITRSAGASVNFTLPAIGAITTTTANTATSILGGWATVTTNSNVTWAVSGGNGVAPGSITGLPAAAYSVNTFASGQDTMVTTSVTIGSPTVTTTTTTNSLVFNSPTANVNDPASNSSNYPGTQTDTLVVNSGGILVTPNVGPATVGINWTGSQFGDSLQVTTGNAQHDLIINQSDPNGILNLIAMPADNGSGPVSLTKTGPGTVVMLFGGAQTGGTFLNQGVLAEFQGIGGPSQPATWLTFTGNATLQPISSSCLTTGLSNKVISVNAGVTGTIDNLISLGYFTPIAMIGTSSITGGGSMAFINSNGDGANDEFVLGNRVDDSYAGSTTIYGGQMMINYLGSANKNKFNAASPWFLGGVLSINPSTTGTTQTLGSNLNLIANSASTIDTQATTGTLNTFNLTGTTGRIIRNSGSTVTFAPIDSTSVLHFGGGLANIVMLGGWATYGVSTFVDPANGNQVVLNPTDWAGVDANGNIVSFTAVGGVYTNDAWSAGNHTNITVSNVSPFSGPTMSLRFNTAGTQIVTLSGAASISSGGILLTANIGGNATTISGGSLTSGNGQDLIVNNFNTTAGASLTIASQITGSIGLTLAGNTQFEAGAGAVVILTNSTNNYAGTTAIDAGIVLKTGAAAVIPSTSAVVLSGQGELNLGTFSQSVGSLASISYGTIVTGSGVTLTVGDDNTSTTFNGAINSTVGLIKVGSGTLTLNAVASYSGDAVFPSNYTGGTTINGGTISLMNNASLGGTSGGLVINGTTPAPSTLQVTGTFNSARTISLGPTSGSGAGTFDVVGPYTLTLTGSIGNQSGGSGGLVKTDTGTLVLTNSGNSYSGGTTITGGILNINADGNLGTSTANPNITFNGSAASGGGTLQFATTYGNNPLGGGRNMLVPAGDSGTIDTNGNNITWGGLLTVGNSGTLAKIGVGSFAIQAAPTLNNNSSLAVSTGTLRFNVTSGGPATIGTGATATVAAGATLELAGNVPALGTTAGIPTGNLVSVVNSSGGAGTTTGGLHVTGTANQLVGTITGTGSTVVESGASLTAYQVKQNSLTINGTGTVTLLPSGSGSATAPASPNNINYSSNVGSLSIAGAPNAWTGTLDIGNNGLVIQYGAGSDPFTTITNMVKSGYNNGAWTGTGITSNLARAAAVLGSPTPALNIGLVDFVPNTGTFGSSILFEGQTISTSAVLVRLTYMDDLVLSGDMAQANATSDALFFAANYGSGTIWHVGDITHDGAIDTNDALLFAANYVVGLPSLDGSTGNAAALGGNAAAVPEPAGVALALLSAMGLWISRRSAKSAKAS